MSALTCIAAVLAARAGARVDLPTGRSVRNVVICAYSRLTYDDAGVRAKWGVAPPSIPDWLAVVGDASDGYPGIPGWGAKSAAAVLAKFGTLEAIPESVLDWEVDLRNASRLAATLTTRDDTVGLGEHVVQDLGGPRAEPLGHEQLGRERDLVQHLEQPVADRVPLRVDLARRGPGQDGGEFRAVHAERLHPPHGAEQHLRQAQAGTDVHGLEHRIRVRRPRSDVQQPAESTGAGARRIVGHRVQDVEQLGGGEVERPGQPPDPVQQGQRVQPDVVVVERTRRRRRKIV